MLSVKIKSLVCVALYRYAYPHSAGAAIHCADPEATILSVYVTLQWSMAEPGSTALSFGSKSCSLCTVRYCLINL